MTARHTNNDTLRQEREKLHAMLLSSVSHDLKTPLACIIGSLEIYQQLKATLSKEHKDTLINTAIEEARRLDSFITNILDMSTLESGVRFTFESLDIGQLVRQCALRMEPALRQHEVVLDLPSQVMAEVSASWISRAVDLLLDNAAKYTAAGTKVMVAVSGDGFSCRIAVRDHGPGIPNGMKAGLFLKSTRTAQRDIKTASTGLGLPICKFIAEAHGGAIRVDSPAEGGGAAFTITLPLTQEDVKAKKRPA